MDIERIVSSALAVVWPEIEQVLTAATYREGRSMTYDATTDTSTETYAHIVTGIKVLKYRDGRKDPQGVTHSPGRSRVLIRHQDLPNTIKRPSTEGRLELSEDGGTVVYDIVGVEDVTARSVWILDVIDHRVAS